MDNYYFHMDNLSVGYDKKALIHADHWWKSSL